MIPLGIPVASTGHARGAAFSRTWGDVAKLIKWNIRSVVYDTVVVAHICFFLSWTGTWSTQ